MAGLFEKGMLAGLGLLDLSREKMHEFVEDLIKRGVVSRKEGARIFRHMMEKGLREKREMEEKIQKIVGGSMKKMNLATKKDLEKLEKKLARLEKIVSPASRTGKSAK